MSFKTQTAIQFKWIKNLVGEKTTLTAVGDDDQSIYGWRGAKIENINKFAKEKETEIVRLEQNYRSTGNILNAANAVIGKNSNRLGKSFGQRVTTAIRLIFMRRTMSRKKPILSLKIFTKYLMEEINTKIQLFYTDPMRSPEP